MSDRLLIRLHPDGQLSWLAQDAGGRALSAANAGAPPAATVARARSIVALVPSEQVVVLETDAVSTRRAQLARAVPFALEDQLASPVEDLHFALPARFDASRITVAVVARSALRAWIDALAQHGIHPDAMIADALALRARANGATLAIEPERALLRLNAAHAVACDLAALEQWLGVAAPEAVAVHDFREAPRLDLPVVVTEYHERQRDALAFLAGQLQRDPEPNLLQGEFAPAHRHVPVARLWRRAGIAVAAAIALLLLHAGADWLRLSRESARLEGQQRDALRAALPEFGAVAGDPRQLMESALTRMRGGGEGAGLVALLNRIGPILAATTRVTLKGIEYRNETLELGLRAPDVPALDLVREQLATLGLKVEVTAVNSAEGGIDGRLRIGGAKR
jgi:general secretion pathway protein L